MITINVLVFLAQALGCDAPILEALWENRRRCTQETAKTMANEYMNYILAQIPRDFGIENNSRPTGVTTIIKYNAPTSITVDREISVVAEKLNLLVSVKFIHDCTNHGHIFIHYDGTCSVFDGYSYARFILAHDTWRKELAQITQMLTIKISNK